MNIVNIYQAKTQLSHLISLVQKGEEVIIGMRGKPVAKLTPFSPPLKPRKPGAWKSKIKFSKDYDKADKEIEKLFLESEIFPKRIDHT